jgi:hypothetical protein
MNDAKSSLQARDAAPASLRPDLDRASGPGSADAGGPCGENGTDGETGGHTLLSRPVAPQGRKSLFRR